MLQNVTFIPPLPQVQGHITQKFMDQWAWSVPNSLTLHVDNTFQVSFHLHKKCRKCFFTNLYHMPTNQQPTLNQSDFFTPPVIFCLRGFKNLIIVLYINTIYYIHATGVMVIRISKSFSSSPLLNLKVTVSPVVNRKSMFWGLGFVWLNDAWKKKNVMYLKMDMFVDTWIRGFHFF